MERGTFAHSERQDGRAHTADPVGHSKRAGVCMPRTEATGEANPASILTWDVQPPELGQKLLPVVEATNLQYFVPAAPADHARWDTRNYCHLSGGQSQVGGCVAGVLKLNIQPRSSTHPWKKLLSQVGDTVMGSRGPGHVVALKCCRKGVP